MSAAVSLYRKSLVVFILCTALVVAIAVVLNYEAATVGNQIQALPSIQRSCSPSDASCPNFSVGSADLVTENTTDLLGVASPARLSLALNVSGPAPLTSVRLFVGNASAGVVQGPFGQGLHRIVNLTLSATVSVSPGKSYLLSVQGFNGGAYVIESESVTARGQVPYAP